jgi:Flp pilus assembly protein TadD
MVRISLARWLPLVAVTTVALTGCASSNPFAALSRDRGAATPPPLFTDGAKPRSDSGSKNPFSKGLKESSEVAQSIQQGENAESEGRLEEARGLYERALTYDPDSPRAHHRLATIHDRREDFAQARRHYQAALKRAPKDPDILSDLGYSCQLQGRDEESETHLREALKHDGRHRQALFNLGNLYARHGRNDDALSLYRRAGSEDEAQAALAQASNGASGVRVASHRPDDTGIVQTEASVPSADPKKKYPNAATRKLAEEFQRRKAMQAAEERKKQAETRRVDPRIEAQRQYEEGARYAEIQQQMDRIDQEERPGQWQPPTGQPNQREVYHAGAEGSYGPPGREQWAGHEQPAGREQWGQQEQWSDMSQAAQYGAPSPTGRWSNGAVPQGPANGGHESQPPGQYAPPNNGPPPEGTWSRGAPPAGSSLSPAERAARMGLSAGAGGLSLEDREYAPPSAPNPHPPQGEAHPGWSRQPGWAGNPPPGAQGAAPAGSTGAPPPQWNSLPWSGSPAAAASGVAPAGWSNGAAPANAPSEAEREMQRLDEEARRLQQRQAELREQMRQAASAPTVDIRPGRPQQ